MKDLKEQIINSYKEKAKGFANGEICFEDMLRENKEILLEWHLYDILFAEHNKYTKHLTSEVREKMFDYAINDVNLSTYYPTTKDDFYNWYCKLLDHTFRSLVFEERIDVDEETINKLFPEEK